MTNVAIIWWGGREHAIASKLLQEGVSVFVFPWNPWMQLNGISTTSDADIGNFDSLIQNIKHQAISLVVIWPEEPLCNGMVDALQKQWILVVWPSQEASFLESDKDRAKEFMRQNAIPTARSQTFSDADAVKIYLTTTSYPVVVKDAGLAAGKGVKICSTIDEAFAFASDCLSKSWNGEKKIVVEEFLVWREVSAFAFIDTKSHTFRMFSTATDHKAESDGWQWDMTWWMGTFSPAIVSKKLQKNIETMFQNVLRWLKKSWLHYTWPLFAGLMVDKNDEFNVLEFNVRFWDPETQSMLVRMESGLFNLMQNNANGRLQEADEIQFSAQKAITVVLTDPWYPRSWTHKGVLITWLDEILHDVKVFHMGTKKWKDWEIFVNGWRVLSLTAIASTYKEAKEKVYRALQWIRFWGDTPKYRTDIWDYAIEMENTIV